MPVQLLTLTRADVRCNHLFLLRDLGRNFLATIARTMPHAAVPAYHYASPLTHSVSFAQTILYRGAGLDVVWPRFVARRSSRWLFLFRALVRFRSVTSSRS